MGQRWSNRATPGLDCPSASQLCGYNVIQCDTRAGVPTVLTVKKSAVHRVFRPVNTGRSHWKHARYCVQLEQRLHAPSGEHRCVVLWKCDVCAGLAEGSSRQTWHLWTPGPCACRLRSAVCAVPNPCPMCIRDFGITAVIEKSRL